GRIRQGFEVRGEPVSFSDSRPFHVEKDQRDDYSALPGIKWEKDYVKENPFVVSQAFDQTNSPIRRINAIELGKQDCRTFILPLQQNNALAELDPVPEDANKQNEGGAGGAGGGGGGGGAGGTQELMKNQMMMQQQMMGKSGGGGGGGAQTTGNPTPNNQFERN